MIIYKHTCISNGKSYIGLTVKTMEARWVEHCSDANRNKKRKFFAALNKYGKENWLHEVLFESDNEAEILDKEIEFIEKFDSVKNGYNTSKDRFRTGIKHNPESIEKMKIAQKSAHARRKELQGGKESHKEHKPHTSGWDHPSKGKSNANKGKKTGKTWEEIYGIEGAKERREAYKLRRHNISRGIQN